MHKINRHSPVTRNIARTKTGHVVRRPVDQTPAGPEFENVFGLCDSDITVLMRLSNYNDKSRFDALAQRLAVIDDPDSKRSKTIQQCFDEWKPMYLQTASEVQAWPAYLKSVEPDVYKRLYNDSEPSDSQPLESDDNSVDKIITDVNTGSLTD